MCETSLLSNHPKRPALIVFVRGAHHRRCAREGLIGLMMPYYGPKLQPAGPTIPILLGIPPLLLARLDDFVEL